MCGETAERAPGLAVGKTLLLTSQRTARTSRNRILNLGPEGHCKHDRSRGAVTAAAEEAASPLAQCGTQPPALSFEASVLNHLQILLVELLLSFEELLQLLGLPFAQFFAFCVVCGQTLKQ